MEGFPRNADEVRYLAAGGYFPDGAITLNVQESNIVERLMPPILERWRKKRAKDLARLDRKRNAQLKFRVRNILFICFIYKFDNEKFYILMLDFNFPNLNQKN